MPSKQKQPVIVRFAPSPTGMLHIGNVRTALFNYLFAKKMGGKFLLRIEDTDKQRSTDAAVDTIFSGLKWLGLHYDGEAVFQSARIEQHKETAYKLLAMGKAYKCYATADEIEKLRIDSHEDNTKIHYPDRETTRDLSHIDERDFVIRLKTPMTGETTISDIIQGDVTIKHEQIDDFVLLRSDGTPTYMLAVVVDDIDMGITHIIRGDDHLINAFRQAVIYESLGVTLPKFAHIPLIHGDDGAKLSKRHGALSVTDWQKMGYMPEMICNYLAGLGWNMGEQEIFTLQQASTAFDLKNINKSPSRLDFNKINHMSGLYIRALEPTDLIMCLNQFLSDTKRTVYPDSVLPQLISVADLFKKRASNFVELDNELKFFMSMPEMDESAKTLLNDDVNIQNLKKIYAVFESLNDWTGDAINTALKVFLTDNELKMPQIGPVIRAAVAGRVSTPDIAPVLSALHKDIVLQRIKAVF